MDALSLYLPAWPTDRIRRRLPPDTDGQRTPIVLTALERERTLVAACCALSRSAGVQPGMPLAEARALFRHSPHIEPLSPTDDRRDLRRLALWAYRFVPIVAVDGEDGLLLDAGDARICTAGSTGWPIVCSSGCAGPGSPHGWRPHRPSGVPGRWQDMGVTNHRHSLSTTNSTQRSPPYRPRRSV